jgi:hypothetical protein
MLNTNLPGTTLMHYKPLSKGTYGVLTYGVLLIMYWKIYSSSIEGEFCNTTYIRKKDKDAVICGWSWMCRSVHVATLQAMYEQEKLLIWSWMADLPGPLFHFRKTISEQHACRKLLSRQGTGIWTEHHMLSCSSTFVGRCWVQIDVQYDRRDFSKKKSYYKDMTWPNYLLCGSDLSPIYTYE